ncbi:hypothetical protein TRFO_19169 [Tritrichomonas foetus]|uniref:Uncharacterized protein n=1 Tax=Tritrichomonas foetus TaxID=1144522 RepID=A0A1J4KJT9_9EUKA|nr:hypothetical protein TRFO_19169 [Tritrichomonas foetus]|eukprot:OHT11370.1 hypothetical protein TRFO_19169 [Tritrichomonas foetus]
MFLLLFFTSIYAVRKKVIIKPNITRSAFNRTKGFQALVDKNLVSDGKDSSVSGFAKSAEFYNESSGKTEHISVWFVKGGTTVAETIITAYKIDENGNSEVFLGPVTSTGEDLKVGYVLQPVVHHDSNGVYTVYFLHLTKQQMKLIEITKDKFTAHPIVNSGMLHVKGKDLLSFEDDYVMHAYIIEIGTKGSMIFRQPLFCVPEDPIYYACIPLLALDIETKTLSQIMIPDMLNGRTNKLQDPVYSFNVDGVNKRVVLVSKLIYGPRRAEDDEVYKYQYVNFSCPIWFNGVKGHPGIPDSEPSYYSSYDRDLKTPNEVHYVQPEAPKTPVKMLSSTNSGKSGKKTQEESSYFMRSILFYQQASLSTHTMRTTNNGFCFGEYCTVPYQIPANWGIDGQYESQDNRADYSDRFGIRVIKIKNRDYEGLYEKVIYDDIALYLDLRDIGKDRTVFSSFAGDCTIEFLQPPVVNSDGVITFTSLPLQVVYRCRQNFLTYSITIDPSNTTEVEVPDDVLLELGVPKEITFIPTREVLYVMDEMNPKKVTGELKPQTEELLLKYAEVVNKYDSVAYYTGFDGGNYNSEALKLFVDKQTRQDVELGQQYTDVHIKLSVIPLPNNQKAYFNDTLYIKTGQGASRISSSFEIFGVDPHERTNLVFAINKDNDNDDSRVFKRDLLVKNTDLFFEHIGGETHSTIFVEGSMILENSYITHSNLKKIKFRVTKGATLDTNSISDRVEITVGQLSTGIRYKFVNNSRSFDGVGQSRYIVLGRQLAGLSKNYPTDKNPSKIELSGIEENVFMLNPFSYQRGTTAFVDILYFSSDISDGLGFPNTTLIFDPARTSVSKVQLNVPQQLPFENGEKLYVNVLQRPGKTMEIILNLTSKCPIITNSPITCSFGTAVLIPTINDMEQAKIRFDPLDGPSEMILLDEGFILKCKGRSAKFTRAKNVSLFAGKVLLKISVHSSCTKINQTFDGAGLQRFLIGTGWDRDDLVGTLDLKTKKHYVYHTLGTQRPANILIFDQQWKPFSEIPPDMVTEFPADIPNDPTLCVFNKDGERKCSDSLSDLIDETNNGAVDVVSNQDIDSSLLKGSINLKSINPMNQITISGNDNITVDDFQVTNAKIAFNPKSDNVQLTAKNNVTLSNVEEITSPVPVKIKAPNITMGAKLYESIDDWNGVLDAGSLKTPKVSDGDINVDVSNIPEGNLIDFRSGITISDPNNSLGITGVESYDVNIKGSNDVDAIYPPQKESEPEITSAKLLASGTRTFDLPDSSKLRLRGYVTKTRVKSPNGVTQITAKEGSLEIVDGSVIEVGFDTLSLIENTDTPERLIVNTDLDKHIDTTVVFANGTAMLLSGNESINIQVYNAEIHVSTNMSIEYESESARGSLSLSGNEVNEQEYGTHLDPSSSHVISILPSVDDSSSESNNDSSSESSKDSSSESSKDSTNESNDGSTNEPSYDSSNDPNDNDTNSNKLQRGAITGIVIAIIVIVAAVILVIIVIKRRLNRMRSTSEGAQNEENIDDNIEDHQEKHLI